MRIQPFHSRRRGRGFTLIELLVVIAIIALLVSILLPSLTMAKRMAKKVVCLTMHRGYGLATEMYANDNDGIMMDSYKHLDPEVGIPAYWGNDHTMPKDVARCPDDSSTEGLGRLGEFDQYDDDLLVSIGCNENMLSCSARSTSIGKVAFWVPRDKISGKPSLLMTWADWQNNPSDEDPEYAVVKPDTGSMGTMCFRHIGDVSNAVFLDGHAGEIRITIETVDEGHDLADDADWTRTSKVGKYYKCYYPFGVGATQTSGDDNSYGVWPEFELN